MIRLSELDDSENQETMEPVNLYECAKNCVDMLQLNAEKHGVTLTVSGVNVVISANHQMVDEVLYNLCDNAIRYNKEKGSVSDRGRPPGSGSTDGEGYRYWYSEGTSGTDLRAFLPGG